MKTSTYVTSSHINVLNTAVLHRNVTSKIASHCWLCPCVSSECMLYRSYLPTCFAQFLHSCSLRHIPASFASLGSRLLPFRSNHRSFFSCQKPSGSVVSLLPKRSTLCRCESWPNPSGSSTRELLLRSSSMRCFREQKESLHERIEGRGEK